MTQTSAPLFVFGVNGGTSPSIDLTDLDFVFGPGRIIVIACRASSSQTGNTLSVNWFEQQ